MNLTKKQFFFKIVIMKTKIKWTPQRLAILKYLDNNKEHPSAEEIHQALSKDFPTMSVATVYNVLDFLKRTGRVREINIDPEKRRFDPEVTAHHHAICIKCKKIFDISVNLEIPDIIKEMPDFQILDTQLKINVLCPECKNKRDLRVGFKEYECTRCGSIRTARHRPQKCPVCGYRGSLKERKP